MTISLEAAAWIHAITGCPFCLSGDSYCLNALLVNGSLLPQIGVPDIASERETKAWAYGIKSRIIHGSSDYLSELKSAVKRVLKQNITKKLVTEYIKFLEDSEGYELAFSED